VLAGLPISTISPPHGVQNAAARLVAQLRLRDHLVTGRFAILPVRHLDVSLVATGRQRSSYSIASYRLSDRWRNVQMANWQSSETSMNRSRDSRDARSLLATSGVEYRITYKLCLLMHSIHNGKAPPYLANTVTATSGIESRSSDRCEIPWSRLRFGERRFSVAAPTAWNSLHQTRSTVTFKRHVKSVLFERAYISYCSFYFITFNYFLSHCSLLVMFLCKQTHYDYD